MTEIQDAATLAQDLRRTPLQEAAKSAYDALRETIPWADSRASSVPHRAGRGFL